MRVSATLLLACALVSCNQESSSNTGFPPRLDELSAVDFQDSVWAKVLALLEIPALESTDTNALAASLAVPSTLISDAEKNAAETTAQVKSFVTTAAAQKCLEIKTPLIDLNPAKAVGLTSGGFQVVNGAPAALPLPVKVYWMQYKLAGDTDYRSALVTIPDTDPATANAGAATQGIQVATKSESSGSYGYPLVMYSHAGSSGLAYEEIALSLGGLQMGHIIAAPVFPGEPLCKKFDSNKTCTGSDILAQAGTAGPFNNDSVDLLGLHECMKKFAVNASGIPTFTTDTPPVAGNANISAKYLKISATVQSQAQAAGTASSNATLLALAQAAAHPATVVLGAGRGATTSALALARAGGLNSVFFSTATDDTTVATQSVLASSGATPGLFACAAMVAPNATFTAGKNRIFLDYWVNGSSGLLNPTQLAASNAIPGFSYMRDTIGGFRAGAGTDDDKAKLIADFVKNADATMHVGAMHGGLQNFGKQFTAKLLSANTATAASAAKTSAAAQGAALLLHGEKDQVSDLSSSLILSSVGVQTSATLKTAGLAPGANWLSLSITPPATSLNADGSLKTGDFGHVGDASFLGGKTAVYANLTSTSGLSTTPFVNKDPSEAVFTWLVTQCYPAMLADAIP